MTGHIDWDECWQQLSTTFTSVADELRECNPVLSYQTGRRASERWPFDAWAEFSRTKDPARVEDIVVFFSVKREEDKLVASIDISTGEGVVLADGPSRVVHLHGQSKEQAGVLHAVADAKRFLTENVGILREALC